MYFIADFLNHTTLLENFASWTRKAYSSNSIEYKEAMKKFLYDFYLLDEIFRSLMEIYSNIVEEFEKKKEIFTLNTTKAHFQHPKSIYFVKQIEVFFQVLYSLQNSLLHLTKIECDIKIKTSYELERAIKKLSNYGFDEPIISLYEKYFEDIGQSVVKYRDLGMDVVEIINNIMITFDPSTEIIFNKPKKFQT